MRNAVVAISVFLSGAPAYATSPADFVAVNLAQLQIQMGIEATDPAYCSRSSDLCEDMCARFAAEEIVPDSCDSYCAAALPECSDE